MLARIQKSMKEDDQGFTLIELLVVMIIIGILAAVAIPVFLNQKKKAVDASVKSDIVSVANQLEADAVDAQTYPATSGWSYVDIGTITTGTVASVRLSSGVNVRYVSIPNGASGAYCLAGYATKKGASDVDGLDAGGNGLWYFYSSQGGGLNQTPASYANAPGGCHG